MFPRFEWKKICIKIFNQFFSEYKRNEWIIFCMKYIEFICFLSNLLKIESSLSKFFYFLKSDTFCKSSNQYYFSNFLSLSNLSRYRRIVMHPRLWPMRTKSSSGIPIRFDRYSTHSSFFGNSAFGICGTSTKYSIFRKSFATEVNQFESGDPSQPCTIIARFIL